MVTKHLPLHAVSSIIVHQVPLLPLAIPLKSLLITETRVESATLFFSVFLNISLEQARLLYPRHLQPDLLHTVKEQPVHRSWRNSQHDCEVSDFHCFNQFSVKFRQSETWQSDIFRALHRFLRYKTISMKFFFFLFPSTPFLSPTDPFMSLHIHSLYLTPPIRWDNRAANGVSSSKNLHLQP